jgi:type IV pilus assembly protein PilV
MSRRLQHSQQDGFSLVEVLVTILVIALGLLGNASLLMRASKVNQGGVFRTHAVTYSQEIAERMEANPTGSRAGNYTVASGATVTSGFNCVTTLCSAANLATYDLATWQAAVRAALPGSNLVVTQTSAVGANPAVYTIQVNWTEQRESVTYASAGTTETFSYVTTKSVYQ